MAYEKLQIELYQNLFGLNEKASEYITGDGYFLNLRNYGFERPGALVSRPGTQDTASLPFATFITIPRMLANYEATNFGAGISFAMFDSGSNLYGLTTTPLLLNASLTANLTTSFPIDTTIAKNRLYLTNGQVFLHQGLSACTYYSLPGGTGFFSGGALTLYIGGGAGVTSFLPSGTYALTYGYARQIDGTSLFEYSDRYAGPSFMFKNLAATLVGTNPAVSCDVLRLATAGYGASFFSLYVAPPGATFEFIGIYPFNGGGQQSFDTAYAQMDDPDTIQHFTLVPRFLEQYKNMLFMSGFSTTPSVVWHSELGDAENIQSENFFEVRTDNGDNITALKAFQNTLIVFKKSSIHEIQGDSPETLTLKDMTLEYGCVNNEAAVVFENKLWFVDKRGICEYNGPNTFVVSTAVERTFQTLDVSKAKAFHVKKRTEVWFCFGSTTLVYDYHAKAWTIYDNLSIEQGIGSDNLEYGQSLFDLTFFMSGTSHFPLVRFKDDVYTDRGTAITLIAQPPFFKRMGDSTQELFRRFYLDANLPSATLSVTLNIKSDYGTSVVKAMGFYQDRFQKKLEFGVSAKAVSPEWVIKASEQVTINGYALHSRFLRRV